MKLKHFSLAFLFAALFTAPVVAHEEDADATEETTDECSTCKKTTCDHDHDADEEATEEAGK